MLNKVYSENEGFAINVNLKITVKLYDKLNKDLIELTRLQSEIGKELLIEDVKSQSSSNLILPLQIIITIVLNLII